MDFVSPNARSLGMLLFVAGSRKRKCPEDVKQRWRECFIADVSKLQPAVLDSLEESLSSYKCFLLRSCCRCCHRRRRGLMDAVHMKAGKIY